VNKEGEEEMKTAGKILFFLLLVAGVVTVTVSLVGADNDKPFLPGVTVADDHPNGCVTTAIPVTMHSSITTRAPASTATA
jgi:hypothetical protein